MHLRIWNAIGLCAALAAPMVASPLQAEVTHVNDHGFAVLHVTKINAPPDKVWATLIAPQSFWNSSHSWSGDAANLMLDPRAGGCFCEKWASKSGPSAANSVEHMRVIYAEAPRILRLSGALGPLQSEGVAATLNIAMEADGAGTKISMSYVVGGFSRLSPKDIAPAVDAVIGEQLTRLKARAEGRDPALAAMPAKKGDGGPTGPAPQGQDAKAAPVADKPKDQPPAARPPLSERLKAEDITEAEAPTDAAKPDAPQTPAKKKPIVEGTPKPKAKTVPPGTR